jgi:hypothetical protein
VALLTTATVTTLTATGASIASANVGTAVVTGLTVTNASVASLNAGTATITTGNLTFSSTAQRITGDFSNATVASRLAFQTSTTNGITVVHALPNGTATGAFFEANNGSDPTNAATMQIGVDGVLSARINAGIRGTGTYLPMTFNTGGSERVRIDTSGNVGIGTASPVAKLDVISGTARVYISNQSASGFITAVNTTNTAYAPLAINGSELVLKTGDATRATIDSSGNVGIGGTAQAYTKLQLTGTLPTSGGSSVGSWVTGTIPSGTTGDYIGFWSESSTQAASFTLARANHFYTSGLGVGAGSTVTNQYGFRVASTFTAATNNYGFYSDIASGSNRWNFYAAGTARNYFAGGVEDANGNLRKIPQSGSAKTSSYTLATTDVGLFIEVGSGGSITVPNSTFAAGDVVSIFNNTTGNVTLTMSITTAYIAGTDADKNTITLATRGVATILFISGTVCVVTGNVS